MSPIDSATRVPTSLPTPQPAPTVERTGVGGIINDIGDAFEAAKDAAESLIEKLFGPQEPKPADSRETIARRIVQAGGTGTQADVDLVVAEVAKMPLAALQQLESAGTKIVACRDSVTDYATSLKGVQPRGWPPGATWDQVPGAYMPSSNEVVIATRGHGTPAGARVPATGEGHGSVNLVIHEVAHAIDATAPASRNSASTTFNDARTKDIAALSSYETQPGTAGQSESYAESAARYYGGSGGTSKTPALDEYWRNNPLGGR